MRVKSRTVCAFRVEIGKDTGVDYATFDNGLGFELGKATLLLGAQPVCILLDAALDGVLGSCGMNLIIRGLGYSPGLLLLGKITPRCPHYFCALSHAAKPPSRYCTSKPFSVSAACTDLLTEPPRAQ